jgi:hypothetical protein
MVGFCSKIKIEANRNAGEGRWSFGGGGDVSRHPGRDSGWSIAPGLLIL